MCVVVAFEWGVTKQADGAERNVGASFGQKQVKQGVSVSRECAVLAGREGRGVHVRKSTRPNYDHQYASNFFPRCCGKHKHGKSNARGSNAGGGMLPNGAGVGVGVGKQSRRGSFQMRCQEGGKQKYSIQKVPIMLQLQRFCRRADRC